MTLKVGFESQTTRLQATGVELQTLNATVRNTGVELQTLNADVRNTVTGLALESLPSIARDTSTFLTLQSGISPDGSVAGTVVDQSSFQVVGGKYAGDPTGGTSKGKIKKVTKKPAEYLSPLAATAAAMALETQVRNLQKGKLAFDVPPEMKEGKQERVKVRIARGVTRDVEQLLKRGDEYDCSGRRVFKLPRS